MKPDAATRTTRYAFLTLPDYSQIAVANAIEPLRMANRVSGQTAYEWLVVSLDGQPVPASNGLTFSPTVQLSQAGHSRPRFRLRRRQRARRRLAGAR